MNNFRLSRRSLERMQGVHPDLVKVVLLAIQLTEVDFGVIEGLRTIEKQREYVAKGASKTMNSRHLAHPSDGLSRAVDLAIWEDRDLDRVVDADELSWRFPHYKDLATWVKRASVQLNVPVTWGGEWTTLKDGPHFELNRAVYP